ncbi:GntR family transcriptional regulator [Dactylosporangium sp. AC04546]|uniref:GntR family transcriptional regulator n=1 Tax=Dactylosporangium sp. AC04546 TaxID=2862460 RepID=UPI001EE091E2|nr:GntR family transcriptional regulator [Dactylosporangium sp. AC04546]WVK81193.1 GntR family transcriptional regulator [Dactylosporangium sp. AC04546]
MADNTPQRAPLVTGLLSDQIYTAIRADIVAGTLTPGERLVEAEMARSFGVSQAPVRDALRRLAHEGLVLQLPRRGTYVAELSDEQARRSYLVREALEAVAAREFCAHAPDEALEALQASVERMFEASRAGDRPGVIEADVAFHRSVFELSGNPLLPRMWTLVEPVLRGFTAISNMVYFAEDEVARSHLPLLDVFRDRDAEKAARLAQEHVRVVWQRVDGEPGT